MPIEDSPYNFSFKLETDPNLFSFEEFKPGVISSIEVQDSIFDYFPKFKFSIIDDSTDYSEKYFFSEYINFNLELEDVNNNIIKHNFYLDSQELDGLLDLYYVSGKIDFFCFSDFFKQNNLKSKSYNMNITDIVRSIVLKYTTASFPYIPNLKISTSSNFDTWYQSQEYDSEFILKLSKYALNINNKNSPYYTFINLNNDFYFYTVSDLLDQSSIYNYYLMSLSSDDVNPNKDYDKILSYSYSMLGTSYNIKNYNSKIYNTTKSGSYNLKQISLDEKIKDNKIALNKLSIRKQYVNSPKSFNYYGIIDNVSQENHYKGWINNIFVNTISFPYRMTISVMFNASLCSGKVIELYFNSLNEDKNNKAYEYSGNWLILECTHKLINKSSTMTTVLLLGKSSVKIHTGHKFYFDFI